MPITSSLGTFHAAQFVANVQPDHVWKYNRESVNGSTDTLRNTQNKVLAVFAPHENLKHLDNTKILYISCITIAMLKVGAKYHYYIIIILNATSL